MCSFRSEHPLSEALLVERPATKWPDVFGDVQVFNTYPYLLPCGLAASVTLLGKWPRHRPGCV